MPKILNFRVLIEQDENGVFVASVPALPGCHTQGDSYEESLKNIKEAIELCLEVAEKDKSYRTKADLDEELTKTTRFLGITEIPVRFNFPL